MSRPKVVIVGGGFGGLQAARSLAGAGADVLLIDRNNYHLFSPLLYQVASSLLNPSDIAYPIRSVLHDAGARFLMAEVAGVDFAARAVRTKADGPVPYDYLILAAGSETSFFGMDSVGRSAWGLKDLSEALALRNHALRCFEAASREPSAERRRPWLTFVVAGGGPTGVEYAGALSELVRLALARDFPELSPSEVSISLIEAREEVFPTFPPDLGRVARERLERLGVRVRLGTRVTGASEDSIELAGGESIATRTVVWAAGVKPAGLAAELDAARSRTGRVEVDEFLRVRGWERVYAVGDMASVVRDGREVPMIAAPAMQEARHAAANIRRELAGEPLVPFVYRDPGMMAMIGRNAGVAQRGRLTLTGFAGWIAWLVIHLYFLIGFRNRLVVLLGWAWNYLRYDRPIRLIARADDRE